MSEPQAIRVRRTHAIEIALPFDAAVSRFTPEGERAWAPGWEPRYLYPADGRTELGMAFTTGEGAERTLWMMLRHEPQQGHMTYARVTPASRMGTVDVRCEPIDAARTRVTVTYELTGLSEAGNAMLESLDPAAYREFIESWRTAIEAAIASEAQARGAGSVK